MQHQGGWAATFIVVGVVLVLGLIGGVYYVKHGMSHATDSASITATAPSDSTTKDDAKAVTPPVASSDATSKADDTPTKTTAPGTDSSSSTEPSNPSSSSAPAASSNDGTRTSDALPETGPADAMVRLVAVTMTTFAAVAYIRSR